MKGRGGGAGKGAPTHFKGRGAGEWRVGSKRVYTLKAKGRKGDRGEGSNVRAG